MEQSKQAIPEVVERETRERPPRQTEKTLLAQAVEERQQTPVYGSYDVIVVGGGTAGVVAALSAARNGASTLLLEKHSFLGGSLLAGAICFMGFFNIYKPYPDRPEVQLVRGIPDEIVRRLIQEGASAGFYEEFAALDYDSKCVSWDRDKLPVVLRDLLRESGVHVIMGAEFQDVIMTGQAVRGVIWEDRSGRHAAYGKVTVDTSGIAEVAYQAGAPCRIFPERQTGGMSLGMAHVDTERLREYAQSKEAVRLLSYKMDGDQKAFIARLTLDLRKLNAFRERIESLHFMDSPCMIANEKGSFNMINAVTMRFDTTDPDERTKARITLTQSCLKLADMLQKHVPGFEHAVLDWISPEIGIRFGRVVDCVYDITRDDVDHLRVPDDTVGVYGVQDAYLSLGTDCRIEGGWYGIPYRALIPQKVENLLVAGEMVTSDWVVWMSIRLTGGCMLMGQAAGTAAALAARKNILPRQLAPEELREALLAMGAFLG